MNQNNIFNVLWEHLDILNKYNGHGYQKGFVKHVIDA